MLSDLCRQSIVFRDAEALASCLRAITDDPDAEVVRVKNRLNPCYNAAASAGYRDVGLNLRLLDPQALGLGVETHVCEVQLLLIQFAELKVGVACAALGGLGWG
jgi:hypothetical protein